MSWRTRNIRRRNKGKKTKRQKGGGPSLDAIIAYLIKTQTEDGVAVHMETKSLIKNTLFLDSFRIKFLGGNKFKIVSPPKEFIENNDNVYKFSISGTLAKQFVIQSNKLETRAKIAGKILVIDNIKEITTAMEEDTKQIKKEKQALLDANIIENNKKVEISKTSDLFKVMRVDLNKFGRPYKPKFLYYSDAELNYIYYCIEKHLTTITRKTVIEFLDFYNKQNKTNLIPTKMTKDEAILKLETALTMMNFTDLIRKDNLKFMIEKLKDIDSGQKFRFTLDSDSCDPSEVDICFFIECINHYSLGDQVVDEFGLTI